MMIWRVDFRKALGDALIMGVLDIDLTRYECSYFLKDNQCYFSKDDPSTARHMW
jgi:hypothetical protein